MERKKYNPKFNTSRRTLNVSTHAFVQASVACELKYEKDVSLIKESVSQHNHHDVFLICVLNEVVNFENKRCSDKLEEIKISQGSSNSDFSPDPSLSIIN